MADKLIELHEELTEIFNNWNTTNNEEQNTLDYINLVAIYRNLTDILERYDLLEVKYKKMVYKESGENE